MRFNCGPTLGERIRARANWHRWFAWHPVRIDDAKHQCVWLETVWRRTGADYAGGWANYRLHVDPKELPGEPA